MKSCRGCSARSHVNSLQTCKTEQSTAKTPWLNCLRVVGCVLLYVAIGVIICGCEGTMTKPVSEAEVLNTTAQGDKRMYQYAKLPNGFRVLNVRDERSLQTAFAVAVEAGSYADPKQLPGLAHFCEHMLFLGTEKYPDATGFDNFIHANGGFNNAYTASEVTVYFATVSSSAADEGLDRFADFFRAPLFDKKFVSKEVHAIDSEHAKNVQDPMRRVEEVLTSIADPESPVSQFHTGNKETLFDKPRAQGADPMTALKDYFKSNYCPQRMTVVTVGPADLQEQLSQVNKEFGSIGAGHEGCSAKKPTYASPAPFPATRMGNALIVKGTQPQAELWLHFQLPDLSQDYRSQPAQYLHYVMSYGGTNSLTRVLQDNLGVVTKLSPYFDSSSAGTSMEIIMTLTKEGKNHVKLICSVIYAYFAKLRRDGVNMELYKSLKRSNHLKWDWAELDDPMNVAEDMAERLTRLPKEHLLTGDELIDAPNETLVLSLMQQLTPSNMNLLFVNPAMKKANATSSLNGAPVEVKNLPYYNVLYSSQRLDEVFPDAVTTWTSWVNGDVDASGVEQALQAQTDAVTKSTGADGQQSLASIDNGSGSSKLVVTGTPSAVPPGPIEGVPDKVPVENMQATDGSSAEGELFGPQPVQASTSSPGSDLKNKGKKLAKFLQQEFHQQKLEAAPSRSKSTAGDSEYDVWYRRGWVTTSPKAQLYLLLQPPRAPTDPDVSALDSARLSLYQRLLSEEMQPKLVDLEQVGVEYGINMSPGGMTVMFTGFTPTMPLLIKKVLAEFNAYNGNGTVKSSRYGRILQEFRQGLATFSDMPESYARADRDLLITKGAYSRAEMLTALDGISQASVSSAAGEVLLSKPLRLTSLAMGNMAKEEAVDTVYNFVSQVNQPAKLNMSAKSSEIERVAPVVDVADPVEVRKLNPRKNDQNDAIVVSIFAGVSSIGRRIRLAILGQMLSPLAYDELRTRMQLGYVVSAGTARVSNVDYVSCLVQGNVLNADKTEVAIEHVYHTLMPKKLQELTQAEFDSYKESFRQQLLTPPVRFQEEFDHYWGPVSQGGRCFDLRERMLQYLDTLTSKDVLIEEWNKLMMPKADGVRKKVVVKYFAGKVPPSPTDNSLKAAWSKQGFSKGTINMLQRERNRTMVFDRADSLIREQIVQKSGYFSTDLKCDVMED